MPWYMLLAAYGLCFGFQHKAAFLLGKTKFTDTLLQCTYCIGFHCGWMVWLAHSVGNGVTFSTASILEAGIWAFVSAAFCYTLDAVVKWFEVNSAD